MNRRKNVRFADDPPGDRTQDMRKYLHIICACTLALLLQIPSVAQTVSESSQFVYKMPKDGNNYMRYRVENGDTVYVATIKAAVKYATGRGRDWRKENRMVHNFGKTYPYALEAKRLMAEVDATIDSQNLARRKRDRYINAIQQDLLDKYEPVLRNMTVTQGKVLIKLIGRETGFTPYEIIHDYKSGMAAGTWQGIAKLFGGDLKKKYEPNGEDRILEELVKKWESGEYPMLYMSIFGRFPDIPDVNAKPEKKKQSDSARQTQRKEKNSSNPSESRSQRRKAK